MGKHKQKDRQRRQGRPEVTALQPLANADSDLVQLSEGLSVGMGTRKVILINSSKLSSPPRMYDADVAWIEHQPGIPVSLFFGKVDRDQKERLKSRLQIKIPPEDFVRHFWRNSREFEKTVTTIRAALPADSWRDAIAPERWTTKREHSEWANFDYMAVVGTQAAIDLYNVAVGGVARYSRGQGTAGLELHAIVRIQLTVFELTRLLRACAPVVGMIESYMPASLAGPARESEESELAGKAEQ